MLSQVGAQSIQIGTVLASKYRVERILGQGGMGIVLAVRHLELQEEFAVKLMHGREFANPRAVERFLREARAAVRLRSKTEHIVQVHDVGRIESGEPYIVMELLSGQDLSNLLIERGVLPIADACSYVMQAGQALDAAHQLGIIHRDLKPANLFFTRRRNGSPCIKVLDFGISKQVMTEDDPNAIEITGTQDVMGSPLYMSPEIAKAARNATPRSDIWALGAILYKLLTGRAPFQAPSPAELFAKLLSLQPARQPSEFREDIPPELDAVILRSIEKNPDLRYATVREFLADLSPFLHFSAPNPSTESGSTLLLPSPLSHVEPPHSSEFETAPRRRMVRRPSFVEGLPEGFTLQPPPAPPPPGSRPGADTMPLEATPASVAIAAMTTGPIIPTEIRAAPPVHTTEATGSTWGATQSRLSTPRKLPIGFFLGFAALTVVLVSSLAVVLLAIPNRAASSKSSSETTSSVRPIVENSKAPELKEITALPIPESSMNLPLPAPSLVSVPSSRTVVSPKTVTTAAIPTTTVAKPTRRKSNFDQLKNPF